MLACALALSILAAEPGAPPHVWGGEPSGVCSLPTVAWLPAVGCSAVLVDPEVVLTAAHCTQSLDAQTVVFGEDADAPAIVRETLGCVANPAWTGLVDAEDWGYCRLAAPVELPIVPVARGCELDELDDLDALAPAVLAGFGEDEQGALGRKRWVETPILSVDDGLIALGGDGEDSCLGDSGGPVLVELGSGWRVVALIAGGGECGQGGVATWAAPALEFAERDAQLDLDPCRDEAGAWAPNDACGGFAAAPLAAVGAWADGCADAERTGPPSSCEPTDASEPSAGCGCATTPRAPRGLSLLLLALGLTARRCRGRAWPRARSRSARRRPWPSTPR